MKKQFSLFSTIHPLPRALTGVKPTGEPHLGNYFGAIAPAIKLQEDHIALYFIADYHALTTERDPKAIRRNTLNIAAAFLALGLDVGDGSGSFLFRQSAVHRVHELAWYLSVVTGMGTLQRGHAVKAAEAAGTPLSVGTFTYPVLMAADILLYGTDVVPVGKDQHQHVQMAQEMATHLNAAYGTKLKIPKALISDAPVVPGNDGEKMSKSRGNTLAIFADDKTIKTFVKSMKTDSASLADPKDPTKCPVAQLFRLVAPEHADDMDAKYRAGGYGYGTAKSALIDALIARFEGPRLEYLHILADREELEKTLYYNGRTANHLATDALYAVQQAVGTQVPEEEL